ncbi:MAG: polyprenyl synthetase family protein [Planctomycetia bacterium]|nr:polyprenyl synthetase family protein [Planctomycetia bacterium]
MSCVVASSDKKTVDLTSVYQFIATELDQVNSLLQKQLAHENPYINEVVQYCCQLGGKRLRPVLVLLTAKALGLVRQEHILIATALEMIHTGSLIHDDILDGARFRRHLETVNLRWDSHTAVLAGDLLLIQAMKMITQCKDIQVYQNISEACFSTCEGELRQIAFQSHFDMTDDDYFKVIGGKTAALLKCCCQLGAYFSNASEKTIALFENFGFALGIGFQMIDDILDLIGNENETGKTLGTDLLNHKPTLPLIHYLKNASTERRKEMLSLVQQQTLERQTISIIRDILKKSGSIQYAREKARSFMESALHLIKEQLQGPSFNSEQKEAFNAFSNIISFIILRKK